MVDWADVLMVVGVLLVAIAAYLALGIPGLLAFVGALMMTISFIVSRKMAR